MLRLWWGFTRDTIECDGCLYCYSHKWWPLATIEGSISLAKQPRRHLAEEIIVNFIQKLGQTIPEIIIYMAQNRYIVCFWIWKDIKLKILLISCQNSQFDITYTANTHPSVSILWYACLYDMQLYFDMQLDVTERAPKDTRCNIFGTGNPLILPLTTKQIIFPNTSNHP